MIGEAIELPVRPARLPPALGDYRGDAPLTDTFGRKHDNIRISLTDRCNLRCQYCMPEDVTFLPKDELLSFEEIAELVAVVADLGINKVRLTGGEPLLRRGVPDLVRRIRAVPAVVDLALTTNALLLAEQAEPLKSAGLQRLNISLDTLDPAVFRFLSRRDGLDLVLAGVEAALRAGVQVKFNAVILRGVNEGDIVPLVRYALDRDCIMRFIESMPIGADPWERSDLVTADEIKRTVERELGPLRPRAAADSHAPAEEFEFVERPGAVGFIASVTRPFCGACNRVRLTAEGKLRNCLFALDEIDVKPFLRPRTDAQRIADALNLSIRSKWAGHLINSDQFVKPARTMHAIGG